MNHAPPPHRPPALRQKREIAARRSFGLPPTAPITANVGDEISVQGIMYRVGVTLIPESLTPVPTPTPNPTPNPTPHPTPNPAPPTIGGLFLADKTTKATTGPPGMKLVLLGRGFGATGGFITFGLATAPVALWSDTEIDLSVPQSVSGSFPVTLHTAAGGNYNVGPAFAITIPAPGSGGPAISGISDTSGAAVLRAVPGEQIVITGSGFGSATGTVTYASVQIPVVSWSDTRIVATLGVAAIQPPSLAVTNAAGLSMVTLAFPVLPP